MIYLKSVFAKLCKYVIDYIFFHFVYLPPRNARGGDGAEVIYALRNSDRLSKLILSELEQEGQNPRKVFQRRLPSNTNKDYYFIHRNTGNTEPVIIEYGFLDSTNDDVLQLKNNYERYSEAVVRAVLEYIGMEYVSNDEDNVYIVKPGDTLWSIAKKYNVSVDFIKTNNNLSSNLLTIGQPLKISKGTTNDNDIYYVKSGDTLYGIAQKYNISLDLLKQYNNLVNNNISVGQKLYIPRGQLNEDVIQTDYITYNVISGDTLYNISTKYNVNIDDLRNINKLENDNLIVGQKLLIPVNKQLIESDIIEYFDYKVKSGDTLYSISNKFNTTVDNLKKINNLLNNNLSLNQIIKVPYSELTIYTVKPGDTLYNISKMYGISLDDLKKNNNLNDNLISVGQKLNVSKSE